MVGHHSIGSTVLNSAATSGPDSGRNPSAPVVDYDAWRRRIRSETFSNYHFAMGEALEKAGDVASAIAAYQRALEFEPGLPEALYRLIQVLTQIGQTNEAQKVRSAGLAVCPDFEARVEVGRCPALLADNKVDEALVLLKRAVETSPAYGEGHAYLALALARQHHFADADAAFQRIGTLPPCRAESIGLDCFHIAKSLYRGRGPVARSDIEIQAKILEMAATLHPEHIDLYFHWANVLLSLNEPDQAFAIIERWKSLGGSSLEGRLLMASARFGAGRYAEAEADYRHIMDEVPSSLPAITALMSLLLASGRVDEALTLGQHGLDIDGKNVDLPVQMGLIFLIRNDPGRAEAAFNRVRQNIGDAAWLQTYFGLVSHAQGHLDDAETRHRQTVDAYPGDPWPMINLALLLDAKGQQMEALDLYRDALTGRKAATLRIARAVRPAWMHPMFDRACATLGLRLDAAER